jgi:hypothetical protein
VTRSKIKQARDRIEALRVALLSPEPEEIGAALPGLEEAARCLETVEQQMREGIPGSYDVRRELKLLKNDLRIVTRLIEHGVAFCQSWAKMLGGCPAYTQAGESVPSEELVGSRGTVSLRG